MAITTIPQAIQGCMNLHFIRNNFCVQLEQLRPCSLFAVTNDTSNSYSPTPTRHFSLSSTIECSRSGGRPPCKIHAPSSDWTETSETPDTIRDEETIEESSADERRPPVVDMSIKHVLTELLNCEGVRHDASMRFWVQSRLMETEKKLRSDRRRHRSFD